MENIEDCRLKIEDCRTRDCAGTLTASSRRRSRHPTLAAWSGRKGGPALTPIALLLVALVAHAALGGDVTTDNLTVNEDAVFQQDLATKDPTEFSAATNGLLVYYSLSTNTTPVPDDSGNGHTGTVNGATWVTNGVTDASYSFDGTNDYINMGNSISLSGSFSISLWVNPLAWESASYRALIAKTVSGQNTGFSFEKKGGSSGTDSLWIADGTSWRSADSPSALPSGAWSHVVGVYDGTNITVYVNAQAGTPAASPAMGANSANILLGHSAWSDSDPYRYFSGTLDEVRIYSRALTAAEVQQLYFRDAHLTAGTARFETGVTHTKPLGDLPMAASNYPGWWTARGVIVTNAAVTNDYEAVNCGQVKWFATNAYVELETNLLTGAGTSVAAVVSGFYSTNNYYPITAGQLKNLAAPFYDRLIQEGYTNSYPWTAATTDDLSYAMVNVGQLKKVFGFDLSDGDGDGLPDWWEMIYFGSLSQTAAGDYDGDGTSNLSEYLQGRDPTKGTVPDTGGAWVNLKVFTVLE